MRNFKVLLFFQIKYKLSLRRIRDTIIKSKQSKISAVGVSLLLIFIGASILIPYSIMMGIIFDTFNKSGNISGYFSFLTFTANTMVFLMSVFSVYNIMFADKDREILTPLPIKKNYIFFVNYIILYLGAIISSVIFLLPGFIAYFIKTEFSVVLLLKMLTGAVAFPALPLSIAFVLVSVLLRVSSGFKNKELIATISAVVIVCAALLINNRDIFSILSSKTKNIDFINKILFNSFFYSKSLSLDGISSVAFLLLGYLTAAFITAIIYFYGGIIYDAITERMKYVFKNTKKSKIKIIPQKHKNAFCNKEIKTVLRSPVFALNCLFNIVLAPIAPYIFLKRQNEILSFFTGDFEIAFIGMLMCFCIMALNMVPSTSISREGKCFWITQIIPVNIKEQVKGRIKAAVISYWLCGIIFIILFDVLLKIDFLYIIYGLALILAGAIPFAYSGLYIDLARPKLYWDKESEAVKQNFNGVLGILMGIILSVVYMIPFVIYVSGALTKNITLILEPIVIAVCIFITRQMLYKRLKE